MINGECVQLRYAPESDSSGNPQPVIKTVNCGSAPSNAGTTWDFAACGNQPHPCYDTNGRQLSVDTFASVQEDPVTKQWAVIAFWCPSQLNPIPSTSALREQALRLLPSVGIGTASANTLVNIQTLLWATTSAQRDLGTVTVVGRQVGLRAQAVAFHWNFGDGTTAVTTTPGKAYDPVGDPCDTKLCPSYYGHTYAGAGTATITLTIDWRASYSLDGRTYQVLAGALPGPASTTTITVKQAKGVLVPDDGP